MECQIEVPADRVNTEVEKSYSELKKTARVRGFRRGKAPRQVLVHLYGRAIHADVAQRLMDSSLQEVLSERAIMPLTKPSVEPSELKPREPFQFKARFEVRPDIDAVVWEGLEATRKPAAATSELIDKEIERLRREHATLEPIEDRAAQKGDVVSLALSFEIAGKKESEELEAELGAGEILEVIDSAVVGMRPGEHKHAEGAFPLHHPHAALRGKTAVFHITLSELKRRVLPEVDDELAKDCEEESLEALKTSIGDKISARLKQESDEDVARQLVADLCLKNTVPVPPSLVEQQARISERELRMVAQMSGQSLDDPQLVGRIRADAEMKVRAGLLMAEIAKAQKITVGDADMERGYEELAQQSGKHVAKIKAEYREKNKRDMLIGMILEDKVLDLLEKSAKITESA
jgi:trigger factor